jgi:archaemetzincin
MARICLLVLSLTTAQLATALPARADDGVVTIQVVPLGAVSADLLEEMARALRLEYSAEVVVARPLPLPLPPADAQAHRHHRAEQLLGLLSGRVLPDARPGMRVLGITVADVWAQGQDGDRRVPGAAELNGRTALVSIYQLRRDVRGRSQLAAGLSASAVHYLGHTFGLTHCSESRCAMLDHPEAAASTAAVPTLTKYLGWGCRGQLVSARN